MEGWSPEDHQYAKGHHLQVNNHTRPKNQESIQNLTDKIKSTYTHFTSLNALVL